MPPKIENVPSEVSKTSLPRIFMQEVSPPLFPQIIRKAKKEQQFEKFTEILKHLHINIYLIYVIYKM